MKVHFVQHEPFEGPGTILEWALERGHRISSTMIYKGEPLPDCTSFDMLVIMGGAMSVNEEDRFLWLPPEKKLVAQSVKGGKAVLGICLGAQLLASALGAEVRKNPCKEIGWFPVILAPSANSSPLFKGWPLMFTAFHWHSQTFDLSAGAVRTASSKACQNQAFTYGRSAVALQFHIESTEESVEQLLTNCESEIADGQLYIQSAAYIRSQKQYLPPMRTLLFQLLDVMEKSSTGEPEKNEY